MYIWILLATFMVAFSFYNLSPRADKDDAMSRVKAASIITRFKLENNAAYNTVRCEMLFNKNNGNWRGVGLPYSINSNLNVGYTSFANNLPMGYVKDNSFAVYHYIYVLDNEAEEGGQPVVSWMGAIGSSAQAYMISFAAIPDRWKSKSGSNEPIPAFIRQMGQSERRGTKYGWVSCRAASGDVNDTAVKCVLSGRSSVTKISEYDENGNLQEYYQGLPDDSVFWSNQTFKTVCSAAPCLFAYHRFPMMDQDHYCENLLEEYEAGNH